MALMEVWQVLGSVVIPLIEVWRAGGLLLCPWEWPAQCWWSCYAPDRDLTCGWSVVMPLRVACPVLMVCCYAPDRGLTGAGGCCYAPERGLMCWWSVMPLRVACPVLVVCCYAPDRGLTCWWSVMPLRVACPVLVVCCYAPERSDWCWWSCYAPERGLTGAHDLLLYPWEVWLVICYAPGLPHISHQLYIAHWCMMSKPCGYDYGFKLLLVIFYQ